LDRFGVQECDLRWGCLLLFCEGGDYVYQSLIGFAVLRGKPGNGVAEVCGVKLCISVDFSREEAFSQGAKGNKADAKLFECRDDISG
jgi:hypothetical protein